MRILQQENEIEDRKHKNKGTDRKRPDKTGEKTPKVPHKALNAGVTLRIAAYPGTGNHRNGRGSCEEIGDTETDLTNYTTRAEVDQKVANVKKEAADDATAKANTAQANAISTAAQALETYKTSNDAAVQKNTDAITAINDPTTGILQKAKDYTDNAGKKYATAEQGALAESALQQRDIATGLTNGTISVKGTDVKVKGLGSAAYTESSAYDAAGSATIAYNNAVTYVDGLLEWKYE